MKEEINQVLEVATSAKIGWFAVFTAYTREWWVDFGENWFAMITTVLGSILLVFLIVGHFYKILETRARTKKMITEMDREEREELDSKDE